MTPHAAFQLLAESLPQLVWTCGVDGGCDYVSSQWIAFTGIASTQLLGTGWLNCVHPDDRATMAAEWVDAVVGRTMFIMEFRLRRHDDTYRWFRSRAVPDIDATGTLRQWFGTHTDVQDLREGEQRLAEVTRALEIRVAAEIQAADAASTQLRRTAELLELAQGITHTGSWSYNLDTQAVSWSAELFRIMGLPGSDAAPSLPVQQAFYSPASWTRLLEAVEHACTQGTPYELEMEFTPVDGEPRFAIARGQAERAADGHIGQLFGTLQDVTELVQERRERSRLATRLGSATSDAGIGVWEWKIGSDDLEWNDQMYALYGKPVGARVTHEDWQQTLHPDDLDGASTPMGDVLSGASSSAATWRIRHPIKGDRYIRATARAFRGDHDEPVRMIGVNWDVTAEVLAERLSTEHASQLRAFIRDAPAAIAMLDRQVCYIEASERWMADYGLVRDEVIGRSYYDVLPNLPAHWPALHQRTLAGEVLRNDAEAFPKPDGSVVWMEWESRPWKETSGAIGGLLLFMRDVTQQVQLQLSIQAQSTELARSNDDLQQFAYAASHDLQEPLRAMAGCAQILQSEYGGQLDSDADELIAHMVDGAKRMKELIEDLLSFARVGTHGEPFGTVTLHSVLADALRNLQQAVKESGAEITMDALPTVAADRHQLVQLFQNIVSNAIKYRSIAAPQISVRGERHDGLWEIVVRDNGIGIPVDARERVFQIFQRLHSRTEYAGTGVGLALCRRIVERHGGHIWVAPADGKGTEIRFTLPERVA